MADDRSFAADDRSSAVEERSFAVDDRSFAMDDRSPNALCQLIVEEGRKVAVAAGFAPAWEEVANARPARLAEVARAAVAPAVEVRPSKCGRPLRRSCRRAGRCRLSFPRTNSSVARR